ncbi:MAG: amidoligase family protein [Armatimonadetes bacterium]|nr:amidoligase family protein [Armatimonadota bacterium]
MVDFKTLRFGIEIESTGQTRDTVARAIQSVVGGDVRHVGTPSAFDPHEVVDSCGRIWRVVADSSLSDASPDKRAEIVSPILSYSEIPELQQVIRAVRQAGAKSSKQAGVHVHVDCSEFDGKSLINLAKLYHKQEALILKAFGVSEQRMNRYAKPMNPEFIARIEKCKKRYASEINRLWYGCHRANPGRYDPERYAAVNFTSYFVRGSVEFRLFEFPTTSLHAGMVRAWVIFVLSLGARALNCRCSSSRKRVFDPETARFDFRVFLLHLGLIGDDYKSVRAHLLRLLPGDSAYRRGRPKRDEKGTKKEASACVD